jgi:hypothetical protein
MTKIIFWILVTMILVAFLAVVAIWLPDCINFCIEYMKAGIQP